MNNEIQNIATPGRIFKRNQQDDNQLGFSIVGKIKIGEKKINDDGKEYPSSIDYFRATGAHAEQFHQILGEKPNKLKIVFPNDMPELCCFQRIEGRDSEGNLAAISNGLYHKIWNDKHKEYLSASDEELEIAKTKGILVTKGYGQNTKTIYIPIKHWVERLTLRFIVLEMRGLLGVWELSTNGVASSIPNIIGNYDRMVEAAGRNINKVVFDLSVSFAKGQKPGSISRYPVLTLVPNIGYESAMLLNEYKNSEIVYNKLITDDTIGNLLSNKNDDKLLPAVEENIPIQVPRVEHQNEEPIKDILFSNEPDIPKNKKTTKEEFTPESFKSWIKEVAEIDGDPIPEEMIELLENSLKAITNYKKTDMEAILQFVCDTTDYSLITKQEAERIIKWVNPIEDENGDWTPKSLKRIEQTNMILKYIQDGQKTIY